MALKNSKISEVIKPKTLKFNDGYYELKSEYIVSSNGISFLAYKALEDINDVKSNNFSHLFLTKKQKNSDIIESKKIKDKEYLDIITTLSFFSYDTSNTLKPGVWLWVDSGYNDFEVDSSKTTLKLLEGIPSSYAKYLFRVECLNSKKCRISHTHASTTFYLVYENDGFKLSTAKTPENSEFTYLIDGQQLKLYFEIDDIICPIVCSQNKGAWKLALDRKFEMGENSILYINSTEEIINHYINNSWIKYDRKNAADAIDVDKSIKDLDNQFICHHEYSNNDDVINLIPLKNNLTYQGTGTNGGNSLLSSNGKFIELPQVDYRNYTSIHSGYNQERGNDNIILTFTFTDQTYHLNEGDECVFTLPEYSEETVFPPLYPYEKLNINDSAFVRNGAFASNVPYFADKFKKLQNRNTNINNCTYLCSWLYQPNEESIPVWLDRYYYPDKVSREDALRGNNCFELSFTNILDLYYLNDTKTASLSQFEKEELAKFENELKYQGYVDKISDLTLEGGTTYKFSRISNDMVNEVYFNNAENRLDYVKDQNFNDVSLEELFALNGKQWRKIATTDFNNTHSINFNTNLYINPEKKMGIQLFGSDYKYGFNIQNRKDLNPFIYYSSNETVYMLNNTFNICNQLNIFEKYGETITYIVVSGTFEDIYVFTDKSLFILDYDLRLKNKIKIADATGNKAAEVVKNHIILHNKNLYAIVNDNKDIFKIIFNPETEQERALIKGKNVAYRTLAKNEYVTNFTLVNNSAYAQTAHEIKNLLFHKDRLYAFNYNISKISHDNDTVYGLICKTDDDIDKDKWYYIYNQSLSKLLTDAGTSKYAEFTSEVSIDNISFGPNGYFALARGFEGTDKKAKCIEIYDKTKTKVYNIPLEEFTKIISLDYYRYIDNNLNEHDAFIALAVINNFITFIEYQIDTEQVIKISTGLEDYSLPTFKNIIDSNVFIDKLQENKLYFNLFLQENTTPISYVWDLKEAQEGWYNINVEIDTENAIFNIKINDYTVAQYNNSTHSNFIPYRHTNVSIFDADYYFGTIAKRYGTTLNEILNGNSKIDPYAIINTKAENTVVYNRILSYYEYQAMRLYFTKVNPLILTIPCGIRNGVEEIIRYFKFNKPGSISNKVKINICGIKDKVNLESDMEYLKSSILTTLSNSDCLNIVKEIEFI